MPPRKKKAGKARKAAKAAERKGKEEETQAEATVDNDQASLTTQMQRLQIEDLLQQCDHGCAAIFAEESCLSPDERLCLDFSKEFTSIYNDCIDRKIFLMDSLYLARDATLEKYATVWEDAAKMKWVISLYMANATQNILHYENIPTNIPNDVYDVYVLTSFAYFFENYHKTTINSNRWQQKVVELQNSPDPHSLVELLRKRIPCKCLDKKYQEVKSMPKMGFCVNIECALPKRVTTQSDMFFCGGCQLACYCSSECQKADWKRHKETCKMVRREEGMGMPYAWCCNFCKTATFPTFAEAALHEVSVLFAEYKIYYLIHHLFPPPPNSYMQY